MLCSVGLSTYIISDLNGEKIVVTFSTNELQKTNQKQFRLKIVYVKRKGYNNSFNSWIDKKD